MHESFDPLASSPLPPNDAVLLDRYLAGECSADEAERVRRWLAENPAHRAELQNAQEIREVVAATPVWDVSGQWKILFGTIASAAEEHTGPVAATVPVFRQPMEDTGRFSGRFPGMRRQGYRPAWYAAGLAAALLVGITLPNLWRTLTPTPVREYATQAAQRASFTLPDGSSVMLGPDTRLRFTGHVDRGNRTVELDGQAYFTVTHETGRPFVVTASGVATKVLGTAFGVRGYAEDSAVQVAVTEGKVEVGNTRGTAIVTAGEVAAVMDTHMPQLVSALSAHAAVAWTSGRVRFDNARLGRVVSELERLYNLEIHLAAPQLRDRLLTITLSTESVEEMLNTIAPVLDIRYERYGRTVIFKPYQDQ